MQRLPAIISRYLSAAALLFCAAALLSISAQARPWNPKPKDLALDYSQIVDSRSNGDIVFIWWLVPQIVENSPEAQALLDKYVIVGVAYGHTTPEGTVTFDPFDPLVVKDASGNDLKQLNEPDFPPTMVAMVAGLESVLSKTIGSLGQRIHWSIYNAGNVHSCAKGGMSILLAGTTYNYDTPIPGCASQTP